MTRSYAVVASLGLLLSVAPRPSQAQTTQKPAATPARMSDEERFHSDWANLARYRADNAALGAPAAGTKRVVFMGNSITEGWAPRFATMFPGKPECS